MYSSLSLALAKDVTDVGNVLESAVAALVAEGLGVREAGPSRATLEDVFAELTLAEVETEEESPNEDEA